MVDRKVNLSFGIFFPFFLPKQSYFLKPISSNWLSQIIRRLSDLLFYDGTKAAGPTPKFIARTWARKKLGGYLNCVGPPMPYPAFYIIFMYYMLLVVLSKNPNHIYIKELLVGCN